MPKVNKSVTLIELLIAISLIFMVVMGLSSMEIFSRQHVIGASRRSVLQNELSSVLERMSKNAVQATGDFAKDKPAFQMYTSGSANGLEIRIDTNNPPTPANPDDDLWYIYKLNNNSLVFSCAKVSVASPTCPADENLSGHLLSGVVVDQAMTNSPTAGFYIKLLDQNTAVEVGLVGRFQPTANIASDNPQIQMKARLQTNSVSAH